MGSCGVDSAPPAIAPATRVRPARSGDPLPPELAAREDVRTAVATARASPCARDLVVTNLWSIGLSGICSAAARSAEGLAMKSDTYGVPPALLRRAEVGLSGPHVLLLDRRTLIDPPGVPGPETPSPCGLWLLLLLLLPVPGSRRQSCSTCAADCSRLLVAAVSGDNPAPVCTVLRTDCALVAGTVTARPARPGLADVYRGDMAGVPPTLLLSAGVLAAPALSLSCAAPTPVATELSRLKVAARVNLAGAPTGPAAAGPVPCANIPAMSVLTAPVSAVPRRDIRSLSDGDSFTRGLVLLLSTLCRLVLGDAGGSATGVSGCFAAELSCKGLAVAVDVALGADAAGLLQRGEDGAEDSRKGAEGVTCAGMADRAVAGSASDASSFRELIGAYLRARTGAPCRLPLGADIWWFCVSCCGFLLLVRRPAEVRAAGMELRSQVTARTHGV